MPLHRVGWIGLGAMGSRMARNPIKAGFEVDVWNRTPARAEELGRVVRLGRHEHHRAAGRPGVRRRSPGVGHPLRRSAGQR
ncbi:hypothetical protein DYI95_009595 [Thermaerobacter sp. PB12/4term]|uniref:NAD(P)-binding domain-containing protein n=1 Tax=Thermaerobacter sp. PB12/4term TaxID=2293838 RepID=UPI000E32D2A5|nr:hypothetical protein DYI95_009595 [Thermaerobacter sp. PB12/4term]